jgi:hypothetical protein
MAAMRTHLEELLEVVKPASDPRDESSAPTAAISEWTVDDQSDPTIPTRRSTGSSASCAATTDGTFTGSSTSGRATCSSSSTH